MYETTIKLKLFAIIPLWFSTINCDEIQCAIQRCGDDYVLNSVNCVCEPRNIEESPVNSTEIINYCDPCQNNFTQDKETCECFCDLQCFDTFDTIATFDFDNCSCLRIQCNNTCPDGFVFDGAHCKNLCHDCRCIPDPLLDVIMVNSTCIGFDYDCAEGYWYNPESCRCQLRCDDGFTFVDDECRQICDEFVDCDEDSKWDREACSCVYSCNGECPSGQHFNQDYCLCEDI